MLARWFGVYNVDTGPSSRLYRNFDFFDVRGWRGNGVAVDPHSFHVKLNRFPDELASFFERRCRGDASGKIRNVSAIARCRLREEDGVLAHFSPACFSIERSDFGSRSAER